MIGYVTLGTRDLAKSSAFYDALLAEFGGKRFMESERLIAWFGASGAGGLAVCTPYDGETACIGNGSMVALSAPDRDRVKAIYEKAISLGAKDEGAPGERFPGFYAGYFRDLDGNKLNVYYMGA